MKVSVQGQVDGDVLKLSTEFLLVGKELPRQCIDCLHFKAQMHACFKQGVYEITLPIQLKLSKLSLSHVLASSL